MTKGTSYWPVYAMFMGRRYRKKNRYEPEPYENDNTVVPSDVIISDNCTKSGKF